MKEEIQKKRNWSDVKKSIKEYEANQLIELVKDLYQLSEDNKIFLHARLIKGDDSRQKYKRIILEALHPDVMSENDFFDFDKAEKAIKDFAKATGNDESTLDLMIYFVKCGNQFTLDFGDINEIFYDTLIAMYEKAIESVLKMPQRKQLPFRERLEKIMESAEGIGWGYHDDLCHYYYEAFK
ncbi:MAG: hypothetical protein ABFD75_13320 [Smithella sp.]